MIQFAFMTFAIHAVPGPSTPAHTFGRSWSGGTLVTVVTLSTYGHLFPSLTEKLVDGLPARWEAPQT